MIIIDKGWSGNDPKLLHVYRNLKARLDLAFLNIDTFQREVTVFMPSSLPQERGYLWVVAGFWSSTRIFSFTWNMSHSSPAKSWIVAKRRASIYSKARPTYETLLYGCFSKLLLRMMHMIPLTSNDSTRLLTGEHAKNFVYNHTTDENSAIERMWSASN